MRAKKTKSTKTPSAAQIFTGIAELFTFDGAHKKRGRRPEPEDLGLIENGAFVVEAGKIAWVGTEKELPKKYARAEKIRLRARTVLPAFVESHTHLVFAGNRAGEFERRLRGESYQSIAESGGGILSTVKATREATERELTDLAQKRADRFVRQGVTTIEVKSGYALNVEGEKKMLRAAGRIKGARVVRTFLGAHAIPKEAKSAGAYLKELQKALPEFRALAERVDVFVEKGYFTVEDAREYLASAKKLGFDIAVHAEQLSHFGGAELAVELGARSSEHLIQVKDADIKRLAKSDTTSVLLPSSDLYMNCSYPPARKLIDAGAKVALATDFNPGSSPSQDLALVGVLARIQMKMSLPEVLIAYTLGGAEALGVGDQLGSLTPGKFADFSVLEGGLEELFLEIGRMPITAVYREGKRLI